MTFHRYVALGDSFTEGVGDPDPTRPNGLRGWADRVADVLATQTDDFGYANLAIRGRKLAPDRRRAGGRRALALEPDLVTIHGGGNDMLRPRVDLDALAATYDDAIARLAATGARVVMFTIFDPGGTGIYGRVRGRMAIFNEWVREIADRHDATIVDLWRMRDIEIAGVLDADRMHLNGRGHSRHGARRPRRARGRARARAGPGRAAAPAGRRDRWAANAQWTREFLVPVGAPPRHRPLLR